MRASYYLRLRVRDEPGVLADLARIIAAHGISVDALQQSPAKGDGPATIIVLTHICRERDMLAALDGIEALASVVGKVVKLRVEQLA